MQIIPEKTYRQNLRESEEREERDIYVNRNNAAEAEKQRIEAEKQDILADLDMYGV